MPAKAAARLLLHVLGSKGRRRKRRRAIAVNRGIASAVSTERQRAADTFEAPPAGENLASTLALTWIEHDLMPRVIVADDLAILWGNIAARSLLARKRDIEARLGVLATVDRPKQAALAAFVTLSEVAISSWALRRADGDGHLLFRAQRIDWHGGGMFGVSFFGSGAEFQVRYADLDIIFGLTRAEHRVLLDMLEGLDAEHLAEIHAVSIETTRTHIRNIYAKLQVRSREALFYRLRPYRI
jgi:DNA-binding CsgD family transcriptional regulator